MRKAGKTSAAAADYTITMLTELRSMNAIEGNRLLTYHLEMALQEAQKVKANAPGAMATGMPVSRARGEQMSPTEKALAYMAGDYD